MESAPTPESLDPLLSRLAALGEGPSDQALAKLAAYRDLLVVSNRRYSLLSAADEARIVARHFVESAGFLRWIPRSPLTLLDFGSGGGLPGMLIAILRDECRVLLLEARERKGVFLRHAVRSLSLGNVTVEGSLSIPRRARPSAFDRVVVRAVGDIVGVGDAAAAHLAPGGLLIAAKGSRAIEETEAAERKKRLRGLAWIEHRIDPLTTKDGRLIGGSTLVFRRSPE